MGESHTFPEAPPDWNNLKVIHKNTLTPRASFFLYNSAEDALTRDSTKSKTLSLSGKWKFSVANSPFDAPPEYYAPGFDTSKWGEIDVPGMWQLLGVSLCLLKYPFCAKLTLCSMEKDHSE